MDVFRELKDRVERECGLPRPSVAGNRGKVWASCQRARWRTTPGQFSTPAATPQTAVPAISPCEAVTPASVHKPASGERNPDITASDMARLSHVLTDGANNPALDRSNQPKSRDELDKSNLGLWQTIIARMLNTATYLSQPVVLRTSAVVCVSLHL